MRVEDYSEENNLSHYFDSSYVYSSRTLAMDYWICLQPTGRFWSFLYVALIGTIGGGLYGVMCLYTRLLDKVIGQAQADRLRTRLKLS